MTEAPRWRLTEPHYLNVRELPDGTRCEWEHKETARETGRTVRKLFPVPILLDPTSPPDYNYPGEIIVAHEGETNLGQDIIFIGKPTPGMEPLNEAAQALTDAERMKWDHPIESLPVNGGMTSAEQDFMSKMVASFTAAMAGRPALDLPNAAISNPEVDELKERLAKLEAILAARAAEPAPKVARRA